MLIILIRTVQFSCFKSKYPEIASFLLSAGILRELQDGTGRDQARTHAGVGRDGTEPLREWDGNRNFSKFGLYS